MIFEYDPFTFLNSSSYSHILTISTYYHSNFDLMGYKLQGKIAQN